MTQEEKFKEAKRLYETANADQRYVLECLFPEFAELRDERILEIIKHCIESRYLHTSTIKGISQKECFAWLEKQGEQNLANSAKTCKKSQRMVSAEAKEALYDKPAWSEDDETGWTNTMIMIKECASFHYSRASVKLVIDWLESIKERIGG